MPQWTPPLPMAETFFMLKWPWACRCLEAFTASGSDIPMKLRTAIAVPADLPPASEVVHGSIAKDHFEFLAACSACWQGCPGCASASG